MKLHLLVWAVGVVLQPASAFLPPLKGRHELSSALGSTGMEWLLADDVEIERDGNIVEDLDSLKIEEIKGKLLDLLPRMMGTPEEFRSVEAYVNALEDRYTPVQTIGFLNLAMAGEWQLLFSTNLAGGPKTSFRLREMYQRIMSDSFAGEVENQVLWDLADNEELNFDASGTFTVKCSYKINQGARMVLELDDHVIKLAKGSAVPKDVEGLVGKLHRAMPKELFDPNDHAMDTTYLDANVRIVRMTGPRFEGVRNIFIRRGSIEVNPTIER
jgi:PAP_fibrillin